MTVDEPETRDAATSAGREWPSATEILFRRVPAIGSLREYSIATAGQDALAGLTVAAVAIPQAMAYAIAAGLPPQHGLYTAIVMTTIGALFDSSRQLINGPTNAISIAVFSAISTLPEDERLAAAVMLALLVGAIQLLITVLRFGDLTRYVSHSVIVGFTLGAAILLVMGQLRHGLGVAEGGSAGQSFIVRFYLTWSHWPTIHQATALLFLLAMGIAIGGAILNEWLKTRGGWRVPEFLIAIIACAWIVSAFNLKESGVAVIGSLPNSLPAFQLPEIRWTTLRELSSEALAIAVLGLLEAIAMAKAIAAQTRQKLDIQQQCLSEGLANVGGSLFQCFPGSGSLTRSAINQQAGAVTQWSGVFSAAAVAVVMVSLAPMAAYIPKAALAGILMVSAYRLVDRELLSYHLRTSRYDAALIAATAITAFAISIELCLLVGVLVSFVLYVPRAGKVQLRELVVIRDRVIRERVPGDPECTHLGLFNLEGEMFFGSVPDFEAHLEEIEARALAGAKVVVLRVRELRNPDAVCIHLLDGFLRRVKEQGVTVMLCGVRPQLERALRRSGVDSRLGAENLFLERQVPYSGMVEAVERAYQILGANRCATCPHSARPRPLVASPDEAESSGGWHWVI